MTTGFFRILKTAAIWPFLALAAVMLVLPAQAQFGKGYNFLSAIKDRKHAEAQEMVNDGATIVNTKDSSSGKAGLHYAIEDRNLTGVRLLLQWDANPNQADKKGVTPMALAIRLNFSDAVTWLIKKNADVNLANRSGETPLIIAVQLGRTEIVRMLVKAGANPDLTDNLAGLSARDYATRDRRKQKILAIIEGKEADDEKPKEQQGELIFTGIGDAT